ncbi:hypothetical protein [Nocardia callitridis]|uniref:Uncharacterized protein n=1 Tax=Nocardia callitridis TaxID=648753 RepID=A0ABP9KQX9_9NOCA
MEMHKILIPDMNSDDYPEEYYFASWVNVFYLSMPDFFKKAFDSFGKGAKTPPPTKDDAPQLPNTMGPLVDSSDVFRNYASVALTLNQAILDVQESEKSLAPLAKKSEEISNAGRIEINNFIDVISESAPTVPPEGVSENNYIVSFLTEAYEGAEAKLNEARGANQDVADDVSKETDKMAELEKEIKRLQGVVKELQAEPPNVPQLPTTPPAVTTPDPVVNDPNGTNGLPDPVDPPGVPELPETDMPDIGADDPGDLTDPNGIDGSNGSGVNDDISRAIDNLENQAATNPAAMQTPMSSDGGMGGMGDMMSQMMMMQAMQGMMNRPGTDDQARDLDPLDHAPMPVQAAPQSPAPAAPSTAPAAPAHSAPPPNSSSSQPTGGAPGRTPGPDGSVEYPFPDGRTQRVSPVVAQALDAAFFNKSATDARQAYEKTSAKWTDNKQIGVLVDPSQLMTGDVVTWEAADSASSGDFDSGQRSAIVAAKDVSSSASSGEADTGQRTAIIVSFGPDQPLEVVVKGEMKPFTGDMFAEESMDFSGFAHPNGIEMTEAQDQTAPAPTGGDPGIDAAAPALTAPA